MKLIFCFCVISALLSGCSKDKSKNAQQQLAPNQKENLGGGAPAESNNSFTFNGRTVTVVDAVVSYHREFSSVDLPNGSWELVEKSRSRRIYISTKQNICDDSQGAVFNRGEHIRISVPDKDGTYEINYDSFSHLLFNGDSSIKGPEGDYGSAAQSAVVTVTKQQDGTFLVSAKTTDGLDDNAINGTFKARNCQYTEKKVNGQFRGWEIE